MAPEHLPTGPSDHVSTESMEHYCVGALNEKESRRIKAHLTSCSDCADRLAAVKRFLKMARDGKIVGHFDDSLE